MSDEYPFNEDDMVAGTAIGQEAFSELKASQAAVGRLAGRVNDLEAAISRLKDENKRIWKERCHYLYLYEEQRTWLAIQKLKKERRRLKREHDVQVEG